MPGASIRAWQWPNALGLDAAVIAAAWLGVFAAQLRPPEHPGAAAYLVLGLSVWLTYLADRLFDVNGRPADALLSARHRLTKKYSRSLWQVWGLLLAITVLIAVSSLHPFQLRAGCFLLVACLVYSLLNQLWSKHFFPKEIFVAVIFTAGTQVFLSVPQLNLSLLVFSLLCFMNCLAIAERERAVDAQLCVHSLAGHLSQRWLWTLIAGTCILATLSPLAPALLPSAAALALVFYCRDSIPAERYRVLCDGSLLLGPLFYLLL
ncbi:MAG: hypothetical protein ACLFU4_09650 [Opitutales bacterium]